MDVFTPPETAIEFAEAGGVVSPADWFKLTAADRAALRAAHEVIRRRQALNIAAALQGRLTEEQRRQRDLAALAEAVRSAG